MAHMTGRRQSKASDISTLTDDGIIMTPGGKLKGPLADVVMAAVSGQQGKQGGQPAKPTTPKSKRRSAMVGTLTSYIFYYI